MKKYITLLLLSLSLITIIGCGGKQNLALLTSQELHDQGKAQFDKKKYIKAVDYYQTLIYNFPGESVVDTAQYFLSLSYFNAKEYELAQVEFNRLVVNYPSSVYFTHAIFMKAVCFYEGTPKHFGLDQTDLFKAIKQFEDFIIDFPESELMPDAQAYIAKAKDRLAHKYYNSGLVYTRIGAHKSAKMYYQKVLDEYTNSEFAEEALFGLANANFKLREFDDAISRLNNFLTLYPESIHKEKTEKLLPEILFAHAEYLYKLKKFSDATDKFEQFINTYPGNGKSDKAAEYIKKIEIETPVTTADDQQTS